MDDQDIEILATMAELSNPSPKKIEEHSDIPKSTVHYRLAQLKEEGIIKNELHEINLKALGLQITVITDVMAQYGEEYHESVGRELAEIEGVNQVYFTMGETDFVTISHLPNREMVEGLIEEFERIDEIQRTNSKFVISTIKNEPNPLRDYDVESLLDLDSVSST